MKAFLIIGNLNAATYKQVFPLIKAGGLRVGYSPITGSRWFEVPSDYDSRYTKVINGQKCIPIKSVWYTTLDYPKRHKPLQLTKRYNPTDYPKYDNYDAIEVGRTKDIPRDYDGVMGVPISFLDKWCPEQFEIIKFRHGNDGRDLAINGKCPFFRILIKRK